MTIILFLDGHPHPIDGSNYPAGLGLPRVGDQVVVERVAYRVRSVQWHLDLGARYVPQVVEVRATRIRS